MPVTDPLVRAFARAERIARKALLWLGAAWAVVALLGLGIVALLLLALRVPDPWYWVVLGVFAAGFAASYLLVYAYARFQLAAVRDVVDAARDVERTLRGDEEPRE